jgi:outer membrane protein TolC
MFKNILLIAFLLVTGQATEAQVVFHSLEDAWKYADAHNITILTAKYEAEKALYAKRASYSALLPQVNATGSYTDNLALQTTLIPTEVLGGPPGSYKTLQFGQQFVYAGGLSAQMNVLNLQNVYNARIAQQTEELNKASLANNKKTVYQQVATQFYSFLLMQEAYKLARQSASTADSVFQSVSNKYKEGTVNEANVDVAKLNFERAQQNEISAQYQMLTARNSLKGILNLSVKDSLVIESTLSDNLQLETTAPFQKDPAILLADYQQRISLSQYRASNGAFAPTINVLYNYATQRYDKTFEPFSGATGVAGWFPSQYWSLQASIPLFTSGSRLFQSRKSKIAWNESVAQYENTQKQSAINDENIRLNYEKAAAVLVKTKDVMTLSFDNYMHISYRYEGGIESIESRLNAFKDYIDYQNQYLNSLSDMLVQLYQLKIRQQSF